VNSRPGKSQGAESTTSDEQLLPLSRAVALLTKGMFGGFRQTKPVHKIKLDFQKAPVSFGPWKEYAQQRVRVAAVTGKLRVYAKCCSDPAHYWCRPTLLLD
jgi:hypothetical protein